MSAVTIAPMDAQDLDPVLDIDVACFAEEGTSADAEGVRLRRADQLREELARTWARLRVARDERGGVLGYVLFWHVADEIHLLNVAVAPSARRRGVGRALVSEVVAYGRAHAAAKVLLEVRASNAAAIALYRALGFVEFNVRARYYADGEDGVEMARSLGDGEAGAQAARR